MTPGIAATVEDPTYWSLREDIQRQHPAHDLEIHNGEYVIVAPHDLASANLAINIASELHQWVRPRRLGRVFDSNAGFIFPDGDLIAPDVSYVSCERLPEVPKTFARVVPELVFEIRSGKQRAKACRAKVALLVAEGIDVVVYVDPHERTYEVHRAGQEPVLLAGGDRFEVPDVLPGFGFAIDELWP
jgi:Uma2 family endonuclease